MKIWEEVVEMSYKLAFFKKAEILVWAPYLWKSMGKEKVYLPCQNFCATLTLTLTFYFSEKKTAQLHVYKKEYIYAWWIIYTYKKAYLTWKINLNN